MREHTAFFVIRSPRAFGLACMIVSATLTSIAAAEPGEVQAPPEVASPLRLSLKIDAAVGAPLLGPQRDAFGVGGGGMFKPSFGPTDWLDLQLAVGGLGFRPKDVDGTSGLFGIGGGVRLQFPQNRYRVAPFIDGEPLYIRTGEVNRFGFTTSAGVLFALDHDKDYWLGFHVRYIQVAQGPRMGYDTTDADLLLFGVASQIGIRGERDADRDGLSDRKDRCPKVPGPADNKGCPYLDSDGDGLEDRDDTCPLVVGPRDNHGCPWPDSDKDGVLDQVDSCPTVAGPPRNDGCPWPDTDGDSVVDKDDKCPSVPGLLEFNGCPDADNDGVPEPPDLCPQTPGLVDNQGCPTYREIVITRQRIDLGQKIFFAYDKANILPKSFGLLGEVATAFKDYPGLRVRIEGHTDSTGRLRHNMKLSQARADSVKRYLIGRGVPAGRISSATGYGPSQPLDTNKTSEGRERNRRVEFVVEGLGDEVQAPVSQRW